MDGWMDGYDMLPKYGSFKTVWERHKKWSIKGVCKNKYYEFSNIISRGYTSGLLCCMNLILVN